MSADNSSQCSNRARLLSIALAAISLKVVKEALWNRAWYSQPSVGLIRASSPVYWAMHHCNMYKQHHIHDDDTFPLTPVASSDTLIALLCHVGLYVHACQWLIWLVGIRLALEWSLVVFAPKPYYLLQHAWCLDQMCIYNLSGNSNLLNRKL